MALEKELACSLCRARGGVLCDTALLLLGYLAFHLGFLAVLSPLPPRPPPRNASVFMENFSGPLPLLYMLNIFLIENLISTPEPCQLWPSFICRLHLQGLNYLTHFFGLRRPYSRDSNS